MVRVSEFSEKCAILAQLILYMVFTLVSGLAAAEVEPSSRASVVQEQSADNLLYHALERAALKEPQRVLTDLTGLIASALRSGDRRQVALLELARANACRVIADWNCQQLAGEAAEASAILAKAPLLQVRGIIASGRASSALQDYSRSEAHLTRAERLLKEYPQPDLTAEVYLAYSSVSFAVGRAQSSVDYSRRGLKLFEQGFARDRLTQARLMRNLARAESTLNEEAQAHETLNAAIALDLGNADPKLAGELHLEVARLARTSKNWALEAASTSAVFKIAASMNNPQLKAQAFEAQGLSSLVRGDVAMAISQLNQSLNVLDKLALNRDSLRVLRVLVPLLIENHNGDAETQSMVRRFVSLQSSIDEQDRALAASNFEARMLYTERAFELERSRAEAAALAAQKQLIARNQRLAYGISALAVAASLIVLAITYWQRRTYQRLRHSELRLRAVSNNLPAQVGQFDKAQRYVYANAELEEVLKNQPEDVLGNALISHRSPEEKARIQSYIAQVLKGQTVRFVDEVPVENRIDCFETILVPDQDPSGSVKGFFVLRFDISRLRHAERELQQMAQVDGLTGVANRRYLEERLFKACADAELQQQNGEELASVSLLWIDVDHFKQVNDNRGHLVGDEVLRSIANRLKGCVRHNDLVARMGGDEFVIMLEQTQSMKVGAAVAEKILAAMQMPVITQRGTFKVSVSVGVAFNQKASSPEILLQAADKALYAAKAGGRATYRMQVDGSPAGPDRKVVNIGS